MQEAACNSFILQKPVDNSCKTLLSFLESVIISWTWPDNEPVGGGGRQIWWWGLADCEALRLPPPTNCRQGSADQALQGVPQETGDPAQHPLPLPLQTWSLLPQVLHGLPYQVCVLAAMPGAWTASSMHMNSVEGLNSFSHLDWALIKAGFSPFYTCSTVPPIMFGLLHWKTFYWLMRDFQILYYCSVNSKLFQCFLWFYVLWRQCLCSEFVICCYKLIIISPVCQYAAHHPLHGR